MLRWRLLLGTLLIGGLLGLCYLDYLNGISAAEARSFVPPGGWLFPLALLATVLGTGETLALSRARGSRPQAAVAYLATAAIVAANLIPVCYPKCPCLAVFGLLGWPVLALVFGVLAAFLGEMRRYEKPGEVLRDLAATLFPMFYIGLLMTFVVLLRFWKGGATTGDGLGVEGLMVLLSLIVVVKMGDSGAYTVGRLLGKHKMAPVLSPGKTWEGFGGTMLFAVLGALLVKLLVTSLANQGIVNFELKGTYFCWGAFGIVVGLAGLLGDLAESLLKRDAGVKDSSTWLPGFGGVLDVLDSILFAAPVAYVCWLFRMVP